MADIDDRLEIRIVAARNLAESSLGECNPYAQVRCGGEFEQTYAASNTTDPVWDGSERVIFTDLTESDIDHIIIKVFHNSMGAEGDEPLGQAVVELRTAMLSPGIETTEWYEMVPQIGQDGACEGEVLVEMAYFLGDDSADFDNSSEEDDEDEDEVVAALKPNMLVGTIGRSRSLHVPGKDVVDAYIVLKVEGHKHQTKVRRGESTVWNEAFRLPAGDGSSLLVVKVKDRGILGSRLVGELEIPMVEIAAHGRPGFTKRCRLLGAAGSVEATAVERGEIELTVAWVYDPRYARSLTRLYDAAANLLVGKSQTRRKQLEVGQYVATEDKKDLKRRKEAAAEEEREWMLGEAEVVPLKLSSKEQAEVDERRGAAKMMADRRVDELEERAEHRMPRGDYQVQVHIIEMKDLKGEDLSGLSDPYARVKVLGRAKKTRVVKQVSDAVFDETLYFNLKNVSASAVEAAVIEVEVYDYDAFNGHDMIGKATFDVRDVHAREDHEYYRQWVGLIDTTNDEDRGYQGFLKLSITVLGAGDSQKSHDVEREYLDELDRDLDAGGDAGGMVMANPQLRDPKQVFLVIYVWEAEDLPVMNSSVLTASSGIEAYVNASFNGHTVRTQSVQCASTQRRKAATAKTGLNPVFHEELWIPVAEPTVARKIKIGLWDYNTFGRDKAVAHEYLDYGDVPRAETGKTTKEASSWMSEMVFSGSYGGPRPRWYNLYGAPMGVQGKRGALQNKFGDEASTYRGRVLLSAQILTKPKERESRVAHRKAFAFKANPGLRPATVQYHLRALCLVGSEIPVLRSSAMFGPSRMRIVVSVGQHELTFEWAPNNDRGVVRWNQIDTLKAIDLPVVLDDLPDVCVYLERQTPRIQRVCYARIPAAKLLRQNFGGEPEWIQLSADKVRTRKQGGVALKSNPGAVLMRLGFGLSEDALDPALAWRDRELLAKFDEQAPFQLRVFVYQARNLPASDDNGLIDAYVKIRFGGHKAKTKTKSKTTAPLWYETLSFDVMLPKDLSYAPDVVCQVWDEDTLASNTPMALVRIPTAECPVLMSEAAKPPTPTWRQLSDVSGEKLGTNAGLLINAVLIQKRDLQEKFDRPQSIVPTMRQAWVEVTYVGVRQLKTHHFRQPREPYVQCDVPGTDDESGATFRTKASSKPSGRDANFIERKTIPMELPEDTLYAPQMDLRIYDAAVGITTAFQKPLLGACSIDLSHKVPWNPDGYVAPQMDLFDDTVARRRQKELEAAARARAEAEAAGDGDDDDDNNYEDDVDKDEGNMGFLSVGGGDDEDDEFGPDGEGGDEEVDQFELERRDKAPIGHSGQDTGIGAFEAMAMSDLPEIYEDQLFAEEMQRRQDAAEEAEKRDKAGKRSYLDMLSARLAAATDTDAMLLGEKTYKLAELGIHFPNQWAEAQYLAGREWWVSDHHGAELENLLKTKPFETYTVYRGRYHPNPAKSTLRPVGIFKGIIRVLDADPIFEEVHPMPLQLLQPATYMCRVYVTKAMNLQPVDHRSADPYLRVKLGKQVDDRSTHHLNKTLRPEFCEVFEFSTTLPGPATLKIQVKDWNLVTMDELVGETRIDLEDRWFHRAWQALDASEGEGAAVLPPLAAGAMRVALKPLEIRNLTKDTSSVSQGQLYLWVDILRLSEAHRAPPVDLIPAEQKTFEVRVICWQSKDVPYEMGDYFAQFWIGDSKKQKTDIHWRCRNGRASWNWRLKFKVDLPLASPELGRLNIQLWDQDVFKWNDVLGDTQVDLYKWMLKAYQENRAVNVFKIINDAIKRKEAEEQGLAFEGDEEESISGSSGNDDDDDDDESDGGGGGNETRSDGQGSRGGGGDDDPGDADDETKGSAADDDDIEAPLVALDEEKADEKKKKAEEEGDPKKKKKKKKDDGGSDSEEEGKLEKKAVDNADKDAAYFVAQLKEMVGLGDLDDSAQWLKMTYTKRKRGTVKNVYRGSIAVSVEILPLDEAEVRPAGFGIGSPNSNPVLPPRTGRLSFSYNPIYILTALLGPRLAMQLCCCFACLLFAAVWFYLGMYYTNIYTMMEASGLAGSTDDATAEAPAERF